MSLLATLKQGWNRNPKPVGFQDVASGWPTPDRLRAQVLGVGLRMLVLDSFGNGYYKLRLLDLFGILEMSS